MKLLDRIRECTICKEHLPLGPKPVLQFSKTSRILIVGQAPGVRVHETGIPWNDPSGDRLRSWLGLSQEEFYDVSKIAIVPMGFCYPGKGKSGDLPPRPECAAAWMEKVLKALPQIELILLIGGYAQSYFLGDRAKKTLTETVGHWQEYLPKYIVLPHPSPRNNIWLKRNSWFEAEELPELRKRVQEIMKSL